jgi:hypothetical protein
MDTYKIRIKNWNTHQHYKHRSPPWIKLHTSLLEDYEFECLQDDSKLHLILIWLLASRSKDIHADGDPLLPNDEDYITKKAGLKQKVNLQPLIDSGFIIREAVSEEHREHGNGTPPRRKQSAGRTLSSCKRVVPPEPEPDSEVRGQRSEEDVYIKGENSLVGQGRRPRLPRHQKSTPQPPNPQPQGRGVDPAHPGDWDESCSGEGEIPRDNFAPADLTGRTPTPQEFVDLWNKVCGDLPKVNTLSDSRVRKIRLCLKQQSIDYWRKVFERMNRTPFLNGEGDRGWRADFDWIIKNAENADKVMSGSYDRAPRKTEKVKEAGFYWVDNGAKFPHPLDWDSELVSSGRVEWQEPEGHCPIHGVPLNDDGSCPDCPPLNSLG